MVTSQAVVVKARETAAAAGRAFSSEHPTPYRLFDQGVRELEGLAREAFQAKLRGTYQAIVDKLENGQPLTQEEQELLKLLIVGEAKYYLRFENDLQNWQDELQRLTQEIERLAAQGLDDIDSLLHLQALCRDAKGVLPNIIFYYREKERLARFEKAAHGQLDPEAGRLLADMIKQMMSSPEM
jgi:hypothetical protein